MSTIARPDYDAACRDAATRQGLDPISDALNRAGVVHQIEQTGGFCMVLTVTTTDGTYGVTLADDDADSDMLQVVYYAGTSWHDGPAHDDDEIIYPPLDFVTTTMLLHYAALANRPLNADDLAFLGIDAGLRF